MTRAATKNFRNADGSVNLERAIEAGHEARTDAFRGFMKSARQMIKMHMRWEPNDFWRNDTPPWRRISLRG